QSAYRPADARARPAGGRHQRDDPPDGRADRDRWATGREAGGPDCRRTGRAYRGNVQGPGADDCAHRVDVQLWRGVGAVLPGNRLGAGSRTVRQPGAYHRPGQRWLDVRPAAWADRGATEREFPSVGRASERVADDYS